MECLLGTFRGGSPKRMSLQFSTRISTTTFANLMSMIAATVSSSSLRRVGPKQTPRFAMVIMFLCALSDTLSK
jgi:hypothetical protein